jgi:hypothetical protein
MTLFLRFAFVVSLVGLECACCFWVPPPRTSRGVSVSIRRNAAEKEPESLYEQAERLRAEASAIRASLPQEETKAYRPAPTIATSPWSLAEADYRLYVDIGREDGTWMDPRWGASGRRIEFTLDVRFSDQPCNEQAILKAAVKDNLVGKSTGIYQLDSAPKARLRKGFDEMKCYGGGYRIDSGTTARFHIRVDGTEEGEYGDIAIPEGFMYFSLPAFASQLSKREGPVTVRQPGWHTGWRREESRIVGIFKAVPINDARKRDGF